jgi:hypothetical protein
MAVIRVGGGKSRSSLLMPSVIRRSPPGCVRSVSMNKRCLGAISDFHSGRRFRPPNSLLHDQRYLRSAGQRGRARFKSACDREIVGARGRARCSCTAPSSSAAPRYRESQSKQTKERWPADPSRIPLASPTDQARQNYQSHPAERR